MVKNLPAVQETRVRSLGCEDPLEKGMTNRFSILVWRFHGQRSLVDYSNLPAVQETRIRSGGWEDPPEKGLATHFSILAWRIPWTEEAGGSQ